jgi:hypothetical protein
MSFAGMIRRDSTVMLRESGASSIPEASRCNSPVSGILDRPVKPGDDTVALFDM